MSRALVLASVALLLGATPLPPRTDQMIYDAANVIDDAAERTLELRARKLFQTTGVAIVVLTVPALEDETIGELAVRVGQSWGVGKQGEDRGLVIAFARDDREIFVATGYGTEGYLPDGRVGSFLDRYALPLLRRDQFSEGLARLTDQLIADSAREHDVDLETITGVAPQPRERPSLLAVVLGLLAVLGLGLLALRYPALAFLMLGARMFRGGGFGGGFGGGGFGGGGFGGGGAGRSF